jgi:ATP-dependent Zn protease
MSVIESGAAVNVKYVEHETRSVAIHEAGHAATAHVYRPEVESSRLSIRMRPGGSLGHHQSFAKEERFLEWHRELFGDLIHGLGAMAAERVFYGQNTNGVGGDLEQTTQLATWMVGAWGAGPEPIELNGTTFADETPEQTRQRILKRFEEVGLRLMNRTRGSADAHADPIASILHDSAERVAEAVIEKREIYGDELIELLNAQQFEKPKIDWTQEAVWPQM